LRARFAAGLGFFTAGLTLVRDFALGFALEGGDLTKDTQVAPRAGARPVASAVST
jgi:hypothetical protein